MVLTDFLRYRSDLLSTTRSTAIATSMTRRVLQAKSGRVGADQRAEDGCRSGPDVDEADTINLT